MKRWKVVVVAFLTAATFWFFNALNKNYTTTLNYPVEFVYNRDSLVSVKRLPASIELDVSGGGWSLLRRTAIFNPEPLKVDLMNPVGKTTLSWLEQLPGVREQIGEINIDQILQDTLSLQIEPIMQKWVTPKLDSVSIQLDAGFRIISPIRYSIDSILISGPKSYIDTLERDFTFTLAENGVDDDFDDEVNIKTAIPNLTTLNPQTVNVSFNVDRFLNKEMLVKVEAMNFPRDSSRVLARPDVIVDYVIQESKDREFSVNDFVVIADFKMLRKSDTTVLAMLTAFPPDVLEVTLNPEVIKVITKR